LQALLWIPAICPSLQRIGLFCNRRACWDLRLFGRRPFGTDARRCEHLRHFDIHWVGGAKALPQCGSLGPRTVCRAVGTLASAAECQPLRTTASPVLLAFFFPVFATGNAPRRPAKPFSARAHHAPSLPRITGSDEPYSRPRQRKETISTMKVDCSGQTASSVPVTTHDHFAENWG